MAISDDCGVDSILGGYRPHLPERRRFLHVWEGDSIPTSYLPTGSPQTEEEESALVMYGSNSGPRNERAKPPEIPFQERGVLFARPEWKGLKNPQRVQEQRLRGLIFHIFYEEDHTAPNCKLALLKQVQVLESYDSLSDTENE